MVFQRTDVISSESNAMDCQASEMCIEFRASGQELADGTFGKEGKGTVDSLQDAFLKFKRNRQIKLRKQVLMEKHAKEIQRNEQDIMKLRLKFVEQAKTYIGVPYARRYHEPGTPEYDAPLFLDCCGLVRKVLRDLKEDFGFSVGPWNQAYMFDTLPVDVPDVSEMKPGDLVFVSGVYYKPKMRKQKHNMVHVEIWAGDGEKTIGARWQRGELQIHDSYQYVSKSYHSMVYHFKSIDTWLKGICKSFCREHLWKSSCYVPRKRSIFAIRDPESDQAAQDFSEDEDFPEIDNRSNKDNGFYERGHLVNKDIEQCADPQDEGIENSGKYKRLFVEDDEVTEETPIGTGQDEASEGCLNIEGSVSCSLEHTFLDRENVLCRPNDESFTDNCHQVGDASVEKEYVLGTDDELVNNTVSSVGPDNVTRYVVSHPNTGGTGDETRTSQGSVPSVVHQGKGLSRKKSPNDDDEHSNNRRPARPLFRPNPSYTKLHQKSPTFFIGGHNGAKMVEATLTSFGWKRIHDSNDPSFYLKWVECKKNLDFSSFREGEQLVNHIPNGNLLTTKIGLLTSLQEFERVSNKVQSPTTSKTIQMKEFVPETYKLQNQSERDNFIHHIYQDGETWICKPTGMNQGKGIFLIRNSNELLERLGPKHNDHGRQACFPPPGRVVQRYISNPFLLNGFKADIRTYMLIAGTCPYMVFYHPGYVRLSLVPYSLNQQELHAHLTNQYVQKKHPLYEQVKEETVWSMEKLQEYINRTCRNNLPQHWVFTAFTKRMQEIMLRCFNSVRHKLERKLGYFDLLGFDFMLDENMKVWLIEINVNPALHTNCTILSQVIPELVDGTLSKSMN